MDTAPATKLSAANSDLACVMTRHSIRLLPLLFLFAAILEADTYPRQTGVDVIHYQFRLGVTDGSDEITGEATVTVKFLLDKVGDIQLDLTSATGGKGMTVASVRRGAAMDIPGPASDALVYTHAQNRLRILLPVPGRAGQEFTFTVRYPGIPAAGYLIGNNLHGDRTFFSDSWPNQARQWLPMIDHPYDEATGELIVSAPEHYQVVSNGVLLEEVDLSGKMRRTHWKQSVPISSWLYALAVARFSSHHAGDVDGVPLQTWVYPQSRGGPGGVGRAIAARAACFH